MVQALDPNGQEHDEKKNMGNQKQNKPRGMPNQTQDNSVIKMTEKRNSSWLEAKNLAQSKKECQKFILQNRVQK